MGEVFPHNPWVLFSTIRERRLPSTLFLFLHCIFPSLVFASLRLDDNEEPIYYLTDAMGSVIGLADGNGAEIAEFEYHSFSRAKIQFEISNRRQN